MGSAREQEFSMSVLCTYYLEKAHAASTVHHLLCICLTPHVFCQRRVPESRCDASAIFPTEAEL
jgi:hypothetical protein